MSKTAGYTDQAAGTVKETIGHAIGNENMEKEGKDQHTQGVEEVEEAKEATKIEQEAAEKVFDTFEADKTVGYTDQIVGAVKENIGYLIGNSQMETEGKLQRNKGSLEVDGAKAVNRVEGTVDQISGKVKEVAGKVTGNEKTEYEGKLEKEKGKIKKAANQ
eukprot:TRINITY_DN3396_c0_g3_i1.p1 TRINITY_DN3396_c0_g3~~TRINITY_DN3396_c0_g3_i1.p1  ORF type:complete len:177 (-),score=51.69 TRINITY_DN3396_c0_g3_i1:80-562(-)